MKARVRIDLTRAEFIEPGDVIERAELGWQTVTKVEESEDGVILHYGSERSVRLRRFDLVNVQVVDEAGPPRYFEVKEVP